MLKSVTELTLSPGTYVLVRGNLNAPIEQGVVADTSRILGNLPTLQLLREKGARTILIGHASADGVSLQPIVDILAQHIPVTFLTDPFSSEGKNVLKKMTDGDIVCVENIRRYPGEEANDSVFAKKLAGLATLFVNDDFTSAHRAHTSVVGIPKHLPSYIGIRFAEEYQHLSQAFNPKHPAVLILGGAKPETKLPLVTALAPYMDTIFVFGVSGNSLLKVQGFSVGKSVVAPDSCNEILQRICALPNVFACKDVLTIDAEGEEHILSPEAIGPDDTIVDAGPDTLAHLAKVVSEAHFILWNGPLGWYEKGYSTGTHECAKAIASSHAESIVGGGDTGALLTDGNTHTSFSFVSSAGGAMLEFLAHGTLPGIEALK